MSAPVAVTAPVPFLSPSRPAAPARRGGSRCVAAVLAGLALAAATPPIGWWWLAPAGPALLLLATRGTSLPAGYGLGVLTGLAWLAPVLSWAQAPGVDAWLWLCAAESLLVGLTGILLVAAQRARWPQPARWPQRGCPRRRGGAGRPDRLRLNVTVLPALASASCWTAAETLRDRWPFGGFPWARLAFTQADTPFTRLAAVGGAPLVTAAVALCGGLLAGAVLAATTSGPGTSAGSQKRRPRSRGRLVAVLGGMAVATAAVGFAVPVATGPVSGVRQVAVVQGDVPGQGYSPFRRATAVLRAHLAETAVLAARVREGRAAAPGLVVWPEDSSDVDPLDDLAAGAALSGAARSVGAPLLVGAVLHGPRPATAYNAGLLWGPDGPPGPIYVKQHPVPFGEYLPFRPELASLAGRFTSLVPVDFLPGHRPGELPVAGTTVGDVICFEVAYDAIVRTTVRDGAQLLVLQTNNATFGRSGESAQQLAMAQLRAVETDRTVVLASTVGESAVIDAAGRVVAHTATWRPALLDVRVGLRRTDTLAVRLGAAPEWVVDGVGALLVGLGLVAGRRRRSGPDSGTDRGAGSHVGGAQAAGGSGT
jgi:apolipoprotein N-acyltransferase